MNAPAPLFLRQCTGLATGTPALQLPNAMLTVRLLKTYVSVRLKTNNSPAGRHTLPPSPLPMQHSLMVHRPGRSSTSWQCSHITTEHKLPAQVAGLVMRPSQCNTIMNAPSVSDTAPHQFHNSA